MKLATELCLVALVQHHIKTTFGDTSDGHSLSDLNRSFTWLAGWQLVSLIT